ncbi:tRNA-dihydrouridine synthase [Candidatus Parcubacteria bacterium]|nr:MAG: tRNA-dihydrouridine synthase [Candidatus Parcubacteria bacterium]
MNNFWIKLPIPFTVLAPMDGVTDIVFRSVIKSIARPDVFFTEFTSCDGIISAGKNISMQKLNFDPNEKPIVAQVWGSNPSNFYQTAKYVKKFGFSGIDINIGCPDKTVVKSGAGAALINNPSLTREIIKAVKEGANGLPVSVKTRIGFQKEQVEEWIGFLLEQDLEAISIHLRTVKELSKVPAHWELMPKIIDLRNKINPKTLIIGNGDVNSLSEVDEKHKLYGCEGVMIGTGVFSNPWLFNKTIKMEDISTLERLDLYLKHIRLFNKIWGEEKKPVTLRKFCKTYVNNFSGASALREKMMQTETIEDLVSLINNYKQNL